VSKKVRLMTLRNCIVGGSFCAAGTTVFVDEEVAKNLRKASRKGGPLAKGVRGPSKAEVKAQAEADDAEALALAAELEAGGDFNEDPDDDSGEDLDAAGGGSGLADPEE
jgi:hypothetical protein